MAELLVYWKEHWTERLKPSELAKERMNRSEHDFVTLFLGSYRKGDVIRVEEDGFWTGPNARPWPGNIFRVIKVPGKTKQELLYLEESDEHFKRKYNLKNRLDRKIVNLKAEQLRPEHKQVTLAPLHPVTER